MIKMMSLDMFYFDYEPIMNENEKVCFENGSIAAKYDKCTKEIRPDDILDIKIDTLFFERISQNKTNDEILKSFNYDGDSFSYIAYEK